MFPRHDYEEYRDLEEAHYAYRARIRLRKQVLSPLRKALALECSPAVKLNKKSASFIQKCKALIGLASYSNIIGGGDGGGPDERNLLFKSRMKIVDKFIHKKVIFDTCFGCDGLKLPHQVLASLEKKQDGDTEAAQWRRFVQAEIQWRRLVQNLACKGKLRNCIAVCDVSESMIGTLKEMVCISMGLLVSDLSEKPWQDSVFSFSNFPTLHKIEGEDLHSKCQFMRSIECGEQVDFLKIYERILEIAIAEKLSDAKMPKRIFVFTYTDFRHASKKNWVQDYKEAWANYRKRGYANVPELVFWNLKDPIAEPEVFNSPVMKNNKGGMIITGFSNNLLSLFFKGEADSRSYAAQFHTVYGIDVLPLMKLAPKADDVIKWAVELEELKSLLVMD